MKCPHGVEIPVFPYPQQHMSEEQRERYEGYVFPWIPSGCGLCTEPAVPFRDSSDDLPPPPPLPKAYKRCQEVVPGRGQCILITVAGEEHSAPHLGKHVVALMPALVHDQR